MIRFEYSICESQMIDYRVTPVAYHHSSDFHKCNTEVAPNLDGPDSPKTYFKLRKDHRYKGLF